MKSYKELTTILRSRMKDIKTIVVGFLLMLVLAVLHPSNPAYEGINPNPYLVISIILAAFLGLRNTFIVSPIIAISYMTALWLKTDLLAVESFFSFNNFIMPGAIIIIPTMISVITDGLREKLSEQEKEGQKKSNTIQELERINAQIRDESIQIERKFGSHLQSVTRIFEYAQVLETYDLNRVCRGIVDLTCEQLGEDNCYVYILNEDNLNRSAFRDAESGTLPEIIKKSEFKNFPLIQRSIIKKEISRVEDLSKKDIEESFPSQEGYFGLAMPLMSPTNQVVGIIFIKRLKFLNYIPATFTTFRALGLWSGLCVSRALQVQSTNRNTFVDDITGLFTYPYLLKRLENEFKQAQKFKLPLNVLRFEVPQIESIGPGKKLIYLKLVSHCIDLYRGEVDVVSLGKEEGSFCAITTYHDETELLNFKNKIIREFEDLKNNYKTDVALNMNCYRTSLKNNHSNISELLTSEVAW